MQHEGKREASDDAAIEDTVINHGVRRAQEIGHGTHGEKAHSGENDAQQQSEQHHHREGAVCLILFALAHQLGDKGRAACADHEAHTTQDHDEGHDQIDGGKGGLAGKIGNEQTIHHTVDGREDHHADGGQRKAQQLTVRKVVGKADRLLGHKNLLSERMEACR